MENILMDIPRYIPGSKELGALAMCVIGLSLLNMMKQSENSIVNKASKFKDLSFLITLYVFLIKMEFRLLR